MGLKGWVCNTSAGVDIEVDGEKNELENFAKYLLEKAPPLSRIDEISKDWIDPQGFNSFEIIHSQDDPNAFVPISPDVTICSDCLEELSNPSDRRYRYPFINCTNCGPRFTIIREIPYDRPYTTMASFPMCPECEAEYTDPTDRRFHAQPVACPVCGPHVWLEVAGNFEVVAEKDEAIRQTRKLLKEGKILAIKGLGGFHLACDATNTDAVAELRARKMRIDKPFALMMPDLDAIHKYCQISEKEADYLQGIERPIVVVKQKPDTAIAPMAAPRQSTLGVMLPYTPLHALLVEREPGFPDALVMTSGNLSEEPLSIDNQQAREKLGPLADAFLMHNRDIYIRCDDSVIRSVNKEKSEVLYPLRRSRGYAPYPVRTAWEMPQILAAGAELKNTFCLTKDRYAFISHHIGDLENFETLSAFEHGVQHLESLFRVKPEYLAYDLHPNYLATRYAQQRAESEGLPAYGIQHHHAHAAACMVENNHPPGRPVIALSYDGTGYGSDGSIWGGEVLLANYKSFQRSYHLKPVPLAGGDAAVKDVWRIALAWLIEAEVDLQKTLPPLQGLKNQELSIVTHQITHGVNAPLTSSMGRLFDAVSSLAGVRQKVNYEGQAAIEFEAMVDSEIKDVYPFEIRETIIDPTPMIVQIVQDITAGIPIPHLSAKFHNTIALISLEVCQGVRRQTGENVVALTGGVWQNITLLNNTLKLLVSDGFTVYIHNNVPTNDGGLSLGQAVIAYHTIAD